MNQEKLISYLTLLTVFIALLPCGYAMPRVRIQRWENGDEIKMCGHYNDELIKDETAHIRKKRQSAYMWTNRHLSYRVSTYDWELSPQETDLAFADAFKVWSDVSPLTFTATDCYTVDMEIAFLADSHDDGYTFTSTAAVAHAFVPCGVPLCGDVHFFEELTWANGVTTDGYNLVFVAAHEIGHALGLIHSITPEAIMYSGYKNEHPTLMTDDISQIQTMYGTPEAPVSSLTNNALPDTCGRTTLAAQATTTTTTATTTASTTKSTTTTTTSTTAPASTTLTTTTTPASTEMTTIPAPTTKTTTTPHVSTTNTTTTPHVPTTNTTTTTSVHTTETTGPTPTHATKTETHAYNGTATMVPGGGNGVTGMVTSTKKKGKKTKKKGRKVGKGQDFEDEGPPGQVKKVKFKGRKYKVKHREGGGLVAEFDTTA